MGSQLADDEQRTLPEETAEVAGAAAELDVSEFQLFKTAYCAWYGAGATDGRIAPLFTEYLMRNSVPYWVRHLSRRIQREGAEKAIPPACTITRRRSEAYMRSRGWGVALLLALIMAGFCTMLGLWVPPS